MREGTGVSREFCDVAWSPNSKTCAGSLVGRGHRVVWGGGFQGWEWETGREDEIRRRGIFLLLVKGCMPQFAKP